MLNRSEGLDVNAKTVSEAIEEGLTQLGLTRDEVYIEVLSEGRRGVFGIGSEEAQVRLTPRPAAPEEQVPMAAEAPAPAEKIETVAEEEDTKDEVAQFAEDYLQGLLDNMGIEGRAAARLGTDLSEEGENPPLVLDITGQDLGILIGRRNNTLRALQYIVRLAVNKRTHNRQPILVDVESYRVRRRQSLKQLAQTMAEQAVQTGQRVIMESMSPYERRIVHVTLRNHPAVFTKSIGSHDNRKVTVIPK